MAFVCIEQICEKFWCIKCPVSQPTPLEEVPREIAFPLFSFFFFGSSLRLRRGNLPFQYEELQESILLILTPYKIEPDLRKLHFIFSK